MSNKISYDWIDGEIVDHDHSLTRGELAKLGGTQGAGPLRSGEVSVMICIHTSEYPGTLSLDYDPQAHDTAEAAAKAFHAAICKVAEELGQQPEIEIALQNPATSAQFGTGRNWRVIWEAGPYQWAVGTSMAVWGRWGFTEPHYSFDLCFNDEPMDQGSVDERLAFEKALSREMK